MSSVGATGQKSSLDLDPVPTGATATPAVSPAAGSPTTLSCPNCHTENAEGALFCEACGYDFTTGAMPRDPSAPPEGEGGSSGENGDGNGGGDGTPSPVDPASSDPASSDPASSDPTASDPTASEPIDSPDAGDGPAAASSTSATSAAGSSPGEPSPAASVFEWLAEVWIDPDWYQTQEAEDPCPSPGLPLIMPLRHKSVLLGRVSTSKNTNPEIDLSSDPGVSRRHAQLTTDGKRWFVEDLGSSNGTFVGPASGPLPATAIRVGPKTELDDDDRLYVGAWTRVVVRRATPDEVEAYA